MAARSISRPTGRARRSSGCIPTASPADTSAATSPASTQILTYNKGKKSGTLPSPSVQKPPAGSGFIDKTTPQYASYSKINLLNDYARQLHAKKVKLSEVMGKLDASSQAQLKKEYAKQYTTFTTDKNGIMTAHVANLMTDPEILK